MIVAEHRRMLFSEHADIRPFMPGATIAEIVSSFDVPAEFEEFGAVYLKRSPDDIGDIVDREYWHRIKPKDGTALFISCVPQGGGGGGGSSTSKQIFMIVAAIALIALTIWIGGGGLSFLAPALFAKGATGALIAAAAVGVAGSTALQMLSKPAAGLPSYGGGATDSGSVGSGSLGVAGVSQNPVRAYQQVPIVRGVFRISPGLLARPFTTIENNDQILHMIVGVCGPNQITGIKINEADIADLPSGVLEYETREGWDDDEALTLVTESVFQENINLQMSTHRLDTDQATLIEPASGSYPKAHIFRSARNTNSFRLTFNFGGLANYADANEVAVPFRIRIRRVGDSTWINLPEIHINASRREGFRQEMWLQWGADADEDVLATGALAGSRLFKRVYYKNAEWTANSYFDPGVSGTTVSTLEHVYPDADSITIFLDSGTFPVGRYDVEITRGFSDVASNYSDTTYTTGMFTYRTLSGTAQTIPSQKDRTQHVAIENYASFRNEYPINARGLALIAIRARNLQVNSLSAVFGSYVNGVVTSNPADLLSDVWTGQWNKRKLSPSALENLASWKSYCTSEGLTCNAVLTDSSVEQAAALIAACGDAILRRSDKYGVVVDKDRSAEPVSAMFGPGNMTGPLTIQKTFRTSARALVPSFNDETDDYKNREFDFPVYDDGVPASTDTLTEAAPYDGLTTEALVRRRAMLDLHRGSRRTIKYRWETHLSHLKSKKGDLVGLQHDILQDCVATGRVRSYVASGGNLVSVTLNTDLPDLPPSGYESWWDVPNVWAIGNVWELTALPIGMQIELDDSSVLTIPIASVDGRTLTVSGTVAVPSGLKTTRSRNGGSLISVGPVDRESRRIILTSIQPKEEFFAALEGVDEAPEIFAGL